MARHFIEFRSNDFTAFWASSEYATVLEYLKEEKKTISVCYDRGIEIIDDEEIFKLEKLNCLRNNAIIVIDRNILISARDIFKIGQIKENRHKFFCALMYYGMSIDCIFDPTIPIYEGGDRYNNKAIDDLEMFRTIDELTPQVFIDLLFGESDKIPLNEWEIAKNKSKLNSPHKINEDFNKDLTLFKYSYPIMLKTVLIMRKRGIDLYHKIDELLQWAIGNFIIKEEPLLVAMYCFKINGGVLKKTGSDDYLELIKNAKNAAWDVTLISYLKDQVKKNNGKYYILVSEDKNLLEAAKYFYGPEMNYGQKFGKDEKRILKLIRNANEIQSKKNPEEIIKNCLDNIKATIISLENDIKNDTCTEVLIRNKFEELK